jgi:hypothetical protein
MRAVAGFDPNHRYLIHYRDSIFAKSLDESIKNLGLTRAQVTTACHGRA